MTERAHGGFDALRRRFERSLPARLEALASALDAGGGPPAQTVAEIHRLAGACGLYGQRALAESLAVLERELAALDASKPVAGAQCAALAARLRALAAD